MLHRIEMHIPVRGVGDHHLDEGQRTAVGVEKCRVWDRRCDPRTPFYVRSSLYKVQMMPVKAFVGELYRKVTIGSTYRPLEGVLDCSLQSSQLPSSYKVSG